MFIREQILVTQYDKWLYFLSNPNFFTSDRSLEQDFESQSTALSLTWLEAKGDQDEGDETEDTDDGDNDDGNDSNNYDDH